jgi:hypothetical protein
MPPTRVGSTLLSGNASLFISLLVLGPCSHQSAGHEIYLYLDTVIFLLTALHVYRKKHSGIDMATPLTTLIVRDGAIHVFEL